MNRSRKEELELIRKKIIDAIRFSERYWMIYRKNTFGFSTILDLNYKKSFIEVLLFTNKDVLNRGVPLIQINTPIETEVDFNAILVDPDFDDDGLISPRKIIERINKLINQEFEYHVNVLNDEIDLVNEEFENYPINDIPFFRKIIIYFPNFKINLKVNFEIYPLKPTIYFSKSLLKIIRLDKFQNTRIIKSWNELNPPHIVDLINRLIKLIIKRLKIKEYYKNYQHLLLDNILIGKDIDKIFFKIHRGQSIGILYEGNTKESNEIVNIKTLFKVISGESRVFSGVISIFGKFLQFTNKKDLAGIIHIPDQIESKINNMKIKKAVKYNFKIIPKISKKKIELRKKEYKNKIIRSKNKWILKNPISKGFSILQKINKNREFTEKVLEVTGLLGKKNFKVSELKSLDLLLLSIARALIQSPKIIMFSIPQGLLSRLEYERLNKYLEIIKKKFHNAIIIHGPEIVVSKCEKIVTITGKKADSGTMKELIKKIPQSGELISIELNYPNQKDLDELHQIESAIIIEERKNEKYKLFPKEDPINLIKKIIHIFGPNLQSFRLYKASLHEFVEFLRLS
ncbi:MAG: hypothetical protein KGD57_08435 [Candidatus Lokiarchaeota archaeon]|nr:hypothetical protein [Candidatus Lokiarchaeota archaeon]